ncbi:hypothetical protein JYT96_01725 [Gammaproteobacteria bacterium AH-315-C21]|nr:hypothetical protein [Gammaproteobacteria bacterium AH-315-C21]
MRVLSLLAGRNTSDIDRYREKQRRAPCSDVVVLFLLRLPTRYLESSSGKGKIETRNFWFLSHCCPVNFFPSFRRRPKSRMSLKPLDSGLRRNDRGILLVFMSLVPQNTLIAKHFAR